MQKCCGFNLKTGGMIIGWVGMVSVIASLCMLIPALNDVNTTIALGESPSHPLMSIEFPKETTRSLTATLIGDQVIQLVMNLALMYGICKTNDLCLVPWLLMNLLQLLTTAIVCLILTFVFQSAILFFAAAIGLTIYFYLWMSVLSLFYKLRQEKVANSPGLTIGAIITSVVDPQSPPAYVRMEGEKI